MNGQAASIPGGNRPLAPIGGAGDGGGAGGPFEIGGTAAAPVPPVAGRPDDGLYDPGVGVGIAAKGKPAFRVQRSEGPDLATATLGASVDGLSATTLEMRTQNRFTILELDDATDRLRVSANNVLIDGENGVAITSGSGDVTIDGNAVLTESAAGAAGLAVLAAVTVADIRAILGLQEVIEDHLPITAQTVYTSPTWAAGRYRKITITFTGKLSGFSYLQFQPNADAGANYVDRAVGAGYPNDDAAKGVNNWARVGVGVVTDGAMTAVIEFWPLVNGFDRMGHARSASGADAGAIGTSYQRLTSFEWCDAATDVTSIKLSTTTATMTGHMTIVGELA